MGDVDHRRCFCDGPVRLAVVERRRDADENALTHTIAISAVTTGLFLSVITFVVVFASYVVVHGETKFPTSKLPCLLWPHL